MKCSLALVLVAAVLSPTLTASLTSILASAKHSAKLDKKVTETTTVISHISKLVSAKVKNPPGGYTGVSPGFVAHAKSVHTKHSSPTTCKDISAVDFAKKIQHKGATCKNAAKFGMCEKLPSVAKDCCASCKHLRSCRDISDHDFAKRMGKKGATCKNAAKFGMCKTLPATADFCCASCKHAPVPLTRGGYGAHSKKARAKPNGPTARLKLTVRGAPGLFTEVQGASGLVAPPKAKKFRRGLAKFMHVPLSTVTTGTSDFGKQAAAQTVIYMTAPAAGVKMLEGAFNDGKVAKIGGTTIMFMDPIHRKVPKTTGMALQTKIIIGMCVGAAVFLVFGCWLGTVGFGA